VCVCVVVVVCPCRGYVPIHSFLLYGRSHIHTLNNTRHAGLNKRRIVQRAVMEELVKLVDSGTKPYQMKKGACGSRPPLCVCVFYIRT
jgi:hypothetical protein